MSLLQTTQIDPDWEPNLFRSNLRQTTKICVDAINALNIIYIICIYMIYIYGNHKTLILHHGCSYYQVITGQKNIYTKYHRETQFNLKKAEEFLDHKSSYSLARWFKLRVKQCMMNSSTINSQYKYLFHWQLETFNFKHNHNNYI